MRTESVVINLPIINNNWDISKLYLKIIEINWHQYEILVVLLS